MHIYIYFSRCMLIKFLGTFLIDKIILLITLTLKNKGRKVFIKNIKKATFSSSVCKSKKELDNLIEKCTNILTDMLLLSTPNFSACMLVLTT